MKFYDASRLLYWETDASDVGVGASLLQVMGGMNFLCDEVPDKATLCPITFSSKNLLSNDLHYSSIEPLKYYMV